MITLNDKIKFQANEVKEGIKSLHILCAIACTFFILAMLTPVGLSIVCLTLTFCFGMIALSQASTLNKEKARLDFLIDCMK
jgi:hypothetical protein